MQNRSGDVCPWDAPGADNDLVALQAVLNCASLQGCSRCVTCSERALSLFRTAARKRVPRA